MSSALCTRSLAGTLTGAFLIGAAVAIVATGSAGAHSTPPPPVVGHLVGGIVFTGRKPPGSASRYQPGWVRVVRDNRVVAHTYVHRNKEYRFTLAPGRYGIIAQTKLGACSNRTRIRFHRTSQNNAYCLFH
jgi:hypothetical protein